MPLLKLGIIGKTGQLARALIAQCNTQSHEYVALGRDCLDLSGADDAISKALSAFRDCDVVINAAAYTAVDAAETDETTALRVNGQAPSLIAQYCKETTKGFIHISTDYVFNGNSLSPYPVDYPTDPLGVYGATKLAGENNIKNVGGNFAILRTSWVYDGTGKNFLTTMLRLAETQKELNIVNDQKGRPTYAADLAQACLDIAKTMSSNHYQGQDIFHISNSGDVITWADFAQAIFQAAHPYLPHSMTVKGIASSEYPTPAKRPLYSALDISKFEQTFNSSLPNWSSGIERAILEWAQTRGFK